ncbi:hypothetical protein BAOM_4603 [Peribacillus asahii]|uniref:ParB-like N-terminal domain-containing protein n=1 Tax=Peribacillus asahii TaxID=228899 RepID=A0A3T0KXY3_9BACI|nr:ParB/RepB/Spo0J family partition protein [Peribacillus asahii]AZV45182.1 hypothetical protein BAOM_4603 [Peribacillus asahii]
MDKIQIDEIQVAHYQVWPEMAIETFEHLVADIKKNGITYPIILDEKLTVLDGHHRLKAAKQAGLSSIACIIRKGLTEEEKLEIAHKTNATTRALTKADKMKRAIELREERRSLRQIAVWLGVGKSTVERWLRGVPNGTSTVIGDDGKVYPSKKPKASQNAPTQDYAVELHQLINEKDSEIYKLKEEIQKLALDNSLKEAEIKRLVREKKAEDTVRSFFKGGFDNGLKVFAAIVGLNEDASVADINRAFRKARGKAHPDTGGNDWISQRYNVSYDLFKKLYQVG